MESLCFVPSDIDDLLAPGWYVSTIITACWRESSRGNRMVYVEHFLEDQTGTLERVHDYFVLEGASPRGLAYSRKRLVELFRACGFSPQAGEEIDPVQLEDHQVEIKVGHEEWNGNPRLQALTYRSLQSCQREPSEGQAALFPRSLEAEGDSHA